MPLPLLLIPTVAPFAFGTIKSIFTTDLDIAILGAKASGKTTLINILQTGNVDTLSTATSFEEKVEQIDAAWTKNNVLSKTKILINEKKGSLFKKALSKVTESTLGINVFKRTGADVPGDESFRQTYEDYIVGKDILLLLFDISRYFDPEWDSKDGGKREAQALFDFVYDRRDTLASNGKIILMATHKDLLNSKQFPNEEAILSAFRQNLKGKPYADLGHSCTPVNLTSTEILEQIKNICEERKNG
jgi:GTPase SAR1 family protein